MPALGAEMMHALWEADVTVFKADISTEGGSGQLQDRFWISDNKRLLPASTR